MSITHATLEGEVLTITPNGRIDSHNAASFESEVNESCAQYPHKMLVLDARELEYISSAGLRVILKLKKQNPELSIENASPQVYEIFDVTGFTGMMSVSKALREISVDGCEVIGHGGYGVVYRLDNDEIVKLCFENVLKSDIDAEIAGAKKAFLHGLPTAISYDVVKCGNRFGVVYELIDAKNMSAYLREESERIDELAGILAALAKQIHSTHVSAGALPDLKELYKAKFGELHELLTPEEISKLRAFVDCLPYRDTLIHGDFHTGNIMLQDGEPVLIDMGDVSVGHPLLEIYGMYLVYVVIGRKNPKQVLRAFGVEYDLWRRVWDSFIAAYFPDASEADIKKLEDICDLLSNIKEFFFNARFVNPDQPEILEIVNVYKQNLLSADVEALKRDIAQIEHLFIL